MTAREKIDKLLRSSGAMCDDCISSSAAIRPRQTVNARCREMERAGELERRTLACPQCHRVKIINLPKDGKFEAQRSGVVRQPLISGPAPATQASLPSSHRDAGASQATDTLVCTGIHPTGEVLGPRTKPPVNQPPLQAADLIITGNRSGPPSLANWARSAVSLIAMWSRALVSAATAILPSRRAR